MHVPGEAARKELKDVNGDEALPIEAVKTEAARKELKVMAHVRGN